MKISMNWLSDYVDLGTITPEQLGDQVSLTGIEVADVWRNQDGLKKIVVGHVTECVAHPNSDHLHLCQVDIGESEPVQIVCGAPNVAAGQDVIVALPGARIADNVKIKRSKMRGEVSEGMLCALQEIGFSDQVVPKAYHDGIYVFETPQTPGASVFPILGMDDPILDFDITPNRADTLGMHGAAYEVGAMLKQTPHFPKVAPIHYGDEKISSHLQAKVDDVSLAPQYYLRRVDNVQLKASPMWLQIRLWNAGIRPINNVIDVTNYVLLEYGQPLHAYDADKLGSELVVRQAQNQETLITLDGEQHQLDEQDIVIATDQHPIALAGIVGGSETEVTTDTVNVVLEAAVFQPTLIRKAAQRHNLRTEASIRFEKGIDQGSVQEALNRAVQLLTELAAGQAEHDTLIGAQTIPTEHVITLDPQRVNHILGTEISLAEMAAIFDCLQFKHDEQNGQLVITVPLRRWDIAIEADLVEEVGRLYGYDRLPSTLPVGPQTLGELNPKQRLVRRIKRSLLANGMDETINYALVTEPEALAYTFKANPAVALAWPMTQDHAYLRQNLVSGLLTSLAYNRARKVEDVAIFEQGMRFVGHDPHAIDERATVAMLWSGHQHPDSWNQQTRSYDFYAVKGKLTALFDDLGLSRHIQYQATHDIAELHPGRAALILLDQTPLGFVGELHPRVAQKNSLVDTYVAQLDLDAILAFNSTPLTAQSAARYPAIQRDLAVLVDQAIENNTVIQVIRENGGKYLQTVDVFDVYTGEKLGHHRKSLAYRLTFRNFEDTLTDDQVTTAFAKVQSALEDKLSAQIR